MNDNGPTEYAQADAARFLGVTPQRVLQWRQQSVLEGFYVGKRWFVSASELLAFSEKPRRGPGRPKKNGAS
jgi:hypothetical protein